MKHNAEDEELADAPVKPAPPPKMTRNEVKERVVRAVVSLYEHDRKLFELKAGERTVVHRLAYWMTPEFPRYHVDFDYNRRRDQVKRVHRPAPKKPEGPDGGIAVPDILVHERDESRANLLVVELKMTYGTEDDDDRQKLLAFTSDDRYQYELGLFLALGPQGCAEARFYAGGTEDEEWTDELHGGLQAKGLIPA